MHDFKKGIHVVIDNQRSSKNRILWVTSSAFPDIGGAEWSLQANTCLLKKHFGQIVLTCTEYGDRVVDGIPIIEVNGNLKNTFDEILDWFKPVFIAMQGVYHKNILKWSSLQSLDFIYFLRAPTETNFEHYIKNPRFKVVVNSEWMYVWFLKKWGAKPILLHPIIVPWMVVSKNVCTRRYITHVGDVEIKGGTRVYEIAKHLNKCQFLVTKSWLAFRNQNGWDFNNIKLFQETEGIVTGFENEFPDFKVLSNVEYILPYTNPKFLYNQTKIMLFASTKREAPGRVIVESILNDIPVIISPEGYNERWNGLVYQIEDGNNIDEWCKIINMVLKNGIDNKIAQNMEIFRKNYNTNEAERILVENVFKV